MKKIFLFYNNFQISGMTIRTSAENPKKELWIKTGGQVSLSPTRPSSCDESPGVTTLPPMAEDMK